MYRLQDFLHLLLGTVGIGVFFMFSDLPVISIIWLHLLVRIKSITFNLTLPLFRTMFPNQVSVEDI